MPIETSKLQGVAYDTGTVFSGEDSRPTWNRRQLRQEIKAIDERLHANWVSVFGSEVDRLTDAAEEALSRGLTVSIQPRAFDRPQEYALEHLRQTACAAERLRKQHDPEGRAGAVSPMEQADPDPRVRVLHLHRRGRDGRYGLERRRLHQGPAGHPARDRAERGGSRPRTWST